MAFKASKIGVKTSVPGPTKPKMVHGTWPAEPRIKPLNAQRLYGKAPQTISPTESGGGFGNTMAPQTE
jgi:hypothetical protein